MARKTAAQFLRSDLGVLLALAAVRLVFHLATNGRYGFHRDELQTLEDARHLDWGFVAYPPLVPLAARLEWVFFGPSLTGLRLLPAAAVSAVMVLAGLIARELGGKRGAQLLAALAAGAAPVSLNQGAVLQYVSFDYLWGVTATYLLLRLLKSGDSRGWLAVGAILGLGMQTRYTMGFLALGAACAVFLAARRELARPWLWAGAALSLVIFLPNLVWQARHQFVSLDFLSYLHARDLAQGRYRGFYLEQLHVPVSPVTAPLAVAGLWYCLISAAGRRYRFLGWLFLATFALFSAAGARSYYTAPLYPMLLAAGSVCYADWAGGLAPARRRAAQGLAWALIALGTAVSVLLVSPVAPLGSKLWRFTGRVHDQFREEIGWPELAETVARVYRSLPEPERASTGILAGNYGEGGALNLFGPALGLPRAMSFTNSFWYRGYDPRLPQTVILVGFDPGEGRRLFETCAVVARNANALGVENEESRDHPDILLCRGLRLPWPETWRSHRRFG